MEYLASAPHGCCCKRPKTFPACKLHLGLLISGQGVFPDLLHCFDLGVLQSIIPSVTATWFDHAPIHPASIVHKARGLFEVSLFADDKFHHVYTFVFLRSCGT